MNQRLPMDAHFLPVIEPPESCAGATGRLLTSADAGQLTTLRNTVISQQLADPDCYRLEAESPDFPPSHLGPNGPGEKGLIAGLFDPAGVLVAYGAVTLPPPGKPHRGDALNLPAAERDMVAYLASAMVRADWRGRGLHHRLVAWRLTLAANLGRRHTVSAVWPGNHQSWGHMTAHGMQAKALVEVADNLWRLVLHRDMMGPPRSPDMAQARLIPVTGLMAQRRLIDDGYWLWRRVRTADGVFAELAPPLPLTGEG